MRFFEQVDNILMDGRYGAQWLSNQLHYLTGLPFYQQARACFVIGLCSIIADNYNAVTQEWSAVRVMLGFVFLVVLLGLIVLAGIIGDQVSNGAINYLRYGVTRTISLGTRTIALVYLIAYLPGCLMADEYVLAATFIVYTLGFYLLSCSLPPPREERKLVDA